jgi:ATP-dependent protease HslVU (ClpYQ) peptidase subunit
MTTIAYKDGVMASDSCVSGGGVLWAKINKVSVTSAGALVGFAGDADVREVLQMVDRIHSSDDLPSKREIAAVQTDFAMLIAFAPDDVWAIECDEIEGRFYGSVVTANLGYAAIGSGGKLATGALAAGASAVDAVMIATEFDCYSKAPVYSVSFKKPATKKPPKPKPK